MSQISGGFWNNKSRQRRTNGGERGRNGATANSTMLGVANYNYGKRSTSSSPSSKRIDPFVLLKRILLFTMFVYAVVVVVGLPSLSSPPPPPPPSSPTIPRKEYCEFRNYPQRRYYGLPSSEQQQQQQSLMPMTLRLLTFLPPIPP